MKPKQDDIDRILEIVDIGRRNVRDTIEARLSAMLEDAHRSRMHAVTGPLLVSVILHEGGDRTTAIDIRPPNKVDFYLDKEEMRGLRSLLNAHLEPVQSAPELIDQSASQEHQAYVYERGLDFGAIQSERTREAAKGMLEAADKLEGQVEPRRPPGWGEHPADMRRAEPVDQKPIKPLSEDLAEWTAEQEAKR